MQNPYPGLFRHLGHFLAVIECGTLPRAAEAVSLTQSALSKSIQRLEEEFGTQLLERTTRGMVPTEAGVLLANHFRFIRSELLYLRKGLDALQNQIQGHVTLGAGPAVISSLLPPALAQLSRTHPGVFVEVFDFDTDTTVNLLKNGELDFILSAGLDDNLSDELIAQVLHVGKACIAVRPDHPLASLDRVEPEALEAWSWALPPEGDPLRRQLEIMLRGVGLPPPRVGVAAGSVALLKSVTESTDYLTFLPVTAVEYERQKGQLTLVGEDDWICNWTIRLYRRERGSMTQAAQALAEHLKTMLDGLA